MKIKKKKCSGPCRKELLATTEHFYKYKNNLENQCKKCKKEQGKKYHERLKNRKESEIPYPQEQKCPKCGKIKLAKEFGTNKVKMNGLDSSEVYSLDLHLCFQKS